MADHQLDFDRGYLPKSIMSPRMSSERTIHPCSRICLKEHATHVYMHVCVYTRRERQKTRDGTRGAQGRRGEHERATEHVKQ